MTDERVYKGKGEFREPSKLENDRMEKIRKIIRDVLRKSGNDSLVDIGVDIDLEPEPVFLVMLRASPKVTHGYIHIGIEDLLCIHSELSKIGITLSDISWAKRGLNLSMHDSLMNSRV